MALFWLSGTFVLGVAVGGAIDPRLAFVLCCIVSIIAIVGNRSRLGPFALLAAALLLGCARAPHDPGAPSTGELRYYNGRHATVRGQIVAEPDIRDTGSNYVVSAQSITERTRTLPVAGRLELHTARGQGLEYGDEVQLTGILRTPVNTPYLPYRDILHGKGIDTQLDFPRAVNLGAAASGYLGWIVPFRQHLEKGIDASLPEPEAALLIAITLGARSASLGTVAPVLVSTGLIHLIAISGIKVALVAGTVWTLLVAARRRILVLPVSLATILVYVVLTGATASGERSALMWALVFIASFLGRGTVALVSLGFVAALMVAVDPSLPWDIGFQLSTVGTFSIVVLSGPLLRLLGIVPSPFREALGVTIAAQLGTLPIVAAGFHSLSLVGPLANGLVLPLLPLAIMLGFLLGLLSNVTVLAAPLAAMAYAITHSIVWISHWLAGSAAAISVSSPSGSVSLLYYAALGAVAWFLLRRAGWAPLGQWGSRLREMGLALILVTSVATVSQVRAAAPDRLTFLGSGSSILVQSDGHTAVIDGSSRPLAFLSALGNELGMRVRAIDLVVVTDPRSSNVSGLLALLDHYQVKAVLDVGSQYPARTYANWRRALRSRHIPAYALRTGATTRLGRVTLHAVAPVVLCYAPANCAGILRVTSKHRSLLLAMHAETREQEDIVFQTVPLGASALFLGNISRSSLDFRRVVRAQSVWCAAPRTASRAACATLPQGRATHWPL